MIDFQNVTKLLGGKSILDNASFRINQGERVGMVGPNGAGKTTVFSMILGELPPDKGEILIPERLRIGILRQQIDLSDKQEDVLSYVAATGELPLIQARLAEVERALETDPANRQLLDEFGHLQTTYEHLGGYDSGHRAEAALAGLGFDEDVFHKPLNSFSGGWQMRASMARVLLSEPDILLLDEPSNYLDIPAVEWLQRRLRVYTGTLLLISHDRFLLNSLTNVTLEINGGKATRYSGSYSKYVVERETRSALAEAARKNTEKRRDKLKENIERFRYKASKAAQVQMWIKMLDKIETEELPEQLHFQGRIRIPEPPRCGAEVCAVENVSHSYDGARFVFRDVSFGINNGDKLGIVGYNGMGKTTLLRIIAGTLAPTSGRARLGHNVVIGYQAQEFAELLPAEEAAYDVVKHAAPGDTPPSRIREILGAFGFSGDDAMKQCKVLSGGEKIRLCFARIFVNPPNLLILDEPTTHLDIAAREALQDAIMNYKGTVCFVSHDLEFIRGTATTILEMRHDRVKRFFGNFDYYKEKLAEEEAANAPASNNQQNKASSSASAASSNSSANSGSAAQPQPQTAGRDRRREKAAKRNALLPEKRLIERGLAKCEKIIEDAENEKAEIDKQLMEATPQTDFAALQKRRKALDYDIAEATLEWERLASEHEEFMKKYNEED